MGGATRYPRILFFDGERWCAQTVWKAVISVVLMGEITCYRENLESEVRDGKEGVCDLPLEEEHSSRRISWWVRQRARAPAHGVG